MAVRIRKQHPWQFKNYKSYKPWLRKECDYACVFCDLWERERGGSDNFGSEHYRPKDLFPDLICDYNNLLYSCLRCNSYKRDYWPSTEQLASGQYILNPFEHDVDQHIDKSSAVWQSKTTAGAWNIVKLRLAYGNKVSLREERALSQKLLDQLEDQLKKAKYFETLAKMRREKYDKLTKTREALEEEAEFYKRRLTAQMDKE